MEMRACLLLGALLVSTHGLAQSRGNSSVTQQQRSVEATMVLTGTIEIEPDGRVSGHRLDDADQIPAAAQEVVRNHLAHWRFEPVLVDGQARAVSSQMTLRLVARPQGEDYVVTIDSARFGGGSASGADTDRLRLGERRGRTVYPQGALDMGITATVYVVLEVGRDGNVINAAAQQVNLDSVVDRRRVEQVRQAFASASEAAVRRWSFHVPTTGASAGRSSWTGMVPVRYCIVNVRACDVPGRWQTYVPGPRNRPAWLDDEGARRLSSTAVAGTGLVTGDDTIRLLTPLDES